MILDDILENKRREIEARKRELPLFLLKSQVESAPRSKDFASALAGQGMSLIAEVKKASPSSGVIREDFDVGAIAVTYQENGASAISVLTESRFFQGSLEHLRLARSLVSLPLLRKDFIVDEYQVYESRVFHADAILLIAAALTSAELGFLFRLSSELDMDALVEVHDRVELERALELGANIIGINNRDLRTLEVDLGTSFELAPLVPPDKIMVAESGIHTRRDVVELEKLGVRAVLIGEALMRSGDIGAKMRELLGE